MRSLDSSQQSTDYVVYVVIHKFEVMRAWRPGYVNARKPRISHTVSTNTAAAFSMLKSKHIFCYTSMLKEKTEKES